MDIDLLCKKPKDLIIISEHRAITLFERIEWDVATLNNFSIFLTENTSSHKNILDFEFCLLFQEKNIESNMSFANKVCNYVNRFINEKGKFEINDKQLTEELEEFNEISDLIERYPFRTFIVLNDTNKINERRQLVKEI